jgi:acetyl-CoA synthetase
MNEQSTFEDQPIVWRPNEEVMQKAQLTRFMDQIGVSDWKGLYDLSVGDVERFTEEVLRFLAITFDPPYSKLLDTSGGIEWSKWCVGGGLNITEMCVDRWAGGAFRNQPAVIWEDEEGEVRKISYKLLQAEVETVAAALRKRGIGKGDAVGIHLPMMIETVVALIAVGRIGAIAVPVFSGYGVDAIASRLNAVGAKAIFTCDGFPRRGRPFNAFEVATAAVAASPSIANVFIVTRLQSGSIAWDLPGVTVEFYDLDLIGEGEQLRLDAPEDFAVLSVAEKTGAEDPLIILYTSGTTGKPKGIAHTHCGFPVKSAQDMAFGTDVGRGTRISWVTDIGWMMGPWLIYGALINGGTIVIYDGAPDYPEADRMWEFCAKHKVEILGISPTLVRALAAKGDDLPKRHDLSHLRAFASTGEPWNPAPWRWLFEKVGDSRLPIINYSGGTEISGGILMGNPLLPIKPCSFPAPCPGIAAAILNENGEPVGRGKVGELSIRKPWIGMARGFWQEPERYVETYWSRFEGTWVHGDWAVEDPDGHWYILGRSDDTLKVAGKRVGPAEVESLLVAHEKVTEAAVIGVPDEMKGTAMVAFCVLGTAGAGSETLETELKRLVAKDMGKPLTPSRIHFVTALPKTRNAKVMRRVIRAAYLGEDAGDLSALENPKSVEQIGALR